MRIFLVIEETCFFHPEFVARVLDETKDTVVGAALVTKSSPKNNIEGYIVSHFYFLYLSEIWKLGWRKIGFTLADRLLGRTHSVRRVYESHKIPYFTVEKNINTPEILAKISALEPDVILSSNPLYFGKKLLALPKIACINRHSGLLPNNGGIWPGFQAVRKGETESGAAVHTMTPVIDEGVVLSRRVTPIRKNDTLYTLYSRCFDISADAVLEALDKLRAGDLSPAEGEYPHSYYSFPTREQWKEFRAHGGRYV